MILRSLVILSLVLGAWGHGRMFEPPSRASMWRFDFDNPADWDDNGQNCGGVANQYDVNDGKCGICGDRYQDPQPRKHERGGLYGNGAIVRTYSRGQVIDITIDITANHKGFFEMRLCPWNNLFVPTTQECLDEHLLEIVGTGGGTRYYVPTDEKREFYFQVVLPDNVTCDQCVLQWHYRAGNTWGTFPNGTSCTGCGNQETFWACADIAIY